MVPDPSGWNSQVLCVLPRALFAMVFCADSNRLFESLGSLLFLAWWFPSYFALCMHGYLCSRPCSLPVDTTWWNLYHPLHREMHTYYCTYVYMICIYDMYIYILQLWTVSTVWQNLGSTWLGLASRHLSSLSSVKSVFGRRRHHALLELLSWIDPPLLAVNDRTQIFQCRSIAKKRLSNGEAL